MFHLPVETPAISSWWASADAAARVCSRNANTAWRKITGRSRCVWSAPRIAACGAAGTCATIVSGGVDGKLGESMGVAVPMSGAEEIALKLLRAAQAKASALARADQPPVITLVDFPTSSPPEGLIDDSAAVIELVLKHRLACDYMLQGDTRERRPIECEIKRFSHDAGSVFKKLSESTQKAIRCIYDKCNREYDDFASSYGKMADFEQMLAWVPEGPGCRYTTALPECYVPIVRYWSPPSASEVKELPSFPDGLVNWASEEFEEIKPVRSLRETIEALLESAELPE